MKTTSLPYVQAFSDRHGKPRFYYRKKGTPLTALPGRPGEAEFLAAYLRASSSSAALPRGPEISSFDGLAAAYKKSANFLNLRNSTKTTYWREIERFCAAHGAKRVTHLQRRHIREMMAYRRSSGGPEAANNLLRVLRVLCAFAVENELCLDNPTAGVKRFRKRGDGFPSWSEQDVGKYLASWPDGSIQRLGLILLLYTGQRRSDIVRMGWQDVRADVIGVSQSKTGVALVIPMHPELQRALAGVPKTRLTFLVTQYGGPFKNGASFGNRFREWCDAAGLPNRSAHGLRKAAAVRLVEAGCTSKEVAAITGHASLREIERYTRAADQEKLARAAISRLIKHE